jgi:hypothetical protein
MAEGWGVARSRARGEGAIPLWALVGHRGRAAGGLSFGCRFPLLEPHFPLGDGGPLAARELAAEIVEDGGRPLDEVSSRGWGDLPGIAGARGIGARRQTEGEGWVALLFYWPRANGGAWRRRFWGERQREVRPNGPNPLPPASNP